MSADGALQFVDTNVLLYAYDRSAGRRHERAADLVGALGAQRSGAISVQVLQEWYVNATRKIAQPLDPQTALERVRLLARWPLHAPGGGDVIAAITLAHTDQLSFWDAMILRSADAMGCEVLWSENLSDGQVIGRVTVRNPFSAECGSDRP